jgi:suppressor of tumorigenicity protein 13
MRMPGGGPPRIAWGIPGIDGGIPGGMPGGIPGAGGIIEPGGRIPGGIPGIMPGGMSPSWAPSKTTGPPRMLDSTTGRLAGKLAVSG